MMGELPDGLLMHSLSIDNSTLSMGTALAPASDLLLRKSRQ